MSVTQQTLAVGRGLAAARPARRAWHGGLHGSEYIWATAFALPYVAYSSRLSSIRSPMGCIWAARLSSTAS